MNYVPFIIPLAAIILIGIQYLLEVRLGSPSNRYDAESGEDSGDGTLTKSTRDHFWGKMVPLQLAAIGLPLLAYDVRAGALLILTALLLFGAYRKNCPQ